MKTKLLFIVISLITFTAAAQAVSYHKLKKGKYEIYFSENGTKIQVGDTVTFGTATSDKGFQFISQGGMPTHTTRAGAKAIISKIKVYKNGISLQPWIFVKGFGLVPVAIDIEHALKTEEIIL